MKIGTFYDKKSGEQSLTINAQWDAAKQLFLHRLVEYGADLEVSENELIITRRTEIENEIIDSL